MTGFHRVDMRFGLKVRLNGFEEVAVIAFERTQVVIPRGHNLLTGFFEC